MHYLDHVHYMNTLHTIDSIHSKPNLTPPNRDAARSLFCDRNQRFHITGFMFPAEYKGFPTEQKVCFHRDKLTFFPWWYVLAIGKLTQDLSNKGSC